MVYYYDLHIHSALSPCADDDMTPNNIVNMSLIKGLQIIAVTDHNSGANVRAITEVAGDRLLVVPAMEIETSEEIHIVCYFPDIEAMEKMQQIVKENMIGIKNKEEIFGKQLLMDKEDNIVAKEDLLLVSATKLSIYDVFNYAKSFGGVAVCAHIDRDSYSVLSNLGDIPPDLEVGAVEITEKNLAKLKNEYKDYKILTNSDAHYLENINEPQFVIELDEKSAQKVIEYLCKKE